MLSPWQDFITFYSWVIFHHTYIYTTSSLSIHQLVLAIVNNAAMNIGIYIYIYIYIQISVSFPSEIPGVELLDHMVILFLIFWGNFILFPYWLHKFRLWQQFLRVPISLYPYQHLSFYSFWYSHSDRCEMILWFLSCISLIINCR